MRYLHVVLSLSYGALPVQFCFGQLKDIKMNIERSNKGKEIGLALGAAAGFLLGTTVFPGIGSEAGFMLGSLIGGAIGSMFD
jgi:outer membrane lipoprotein SlyB